MLAKRLKFLREKQGMGQQKVCTALNIEQSTLANYENGKRVPKIDILIKIAQYYNVSTDYLLGLSDVESQNLIPEPKSNEATSKILTTFQQLNGDNQDILIGEAKKLLKEQKLEKSVAADNSSQRTGTDNLGK